MNVIKIQQKAGDTVGGGAYSPMHILFLTLLIVLIIIVIFFIRRKNRK